MEYHYEYKDKIYINTDHLDINNEYSEQYKQDIYERKLLGIEPYYDNLVFELIKDIPFFKCPICGSNRFRTSQTDGKYTIHCSNRDYDRYYNGINVCKGYEIDYKEWTDSQIKNPEWNKIHNEKGQYNA